VTERESTAATAPGSELEAPTEFKTAPGLIMGTIDYMSPEQATGQRVNQRMDIWSTGVMLYEMVAGAMPFKGVTSSHTIVQILEKDPPPLGHLTRQDVPEELERIVSKAMAKNANERYQTARDMLIDLRNLKKQLDIKAEIDRSSSPRMRRGAAADAVPGQKKRVLVITLLAMAVVTVAFFGVNIWRSSRGEINTGTTPPAPVVERTLTYWITVQKFRDGQPYQDPFTMPGELIFEADYRIRVSVRSPQSGYLYILNEGPPEASRQPGFVVVFPSPTANNGSSFVPADQVVQIPEESWLKFDEEQGTEKLWLVFSENIVPELEGLQRFTNPQRLITDWARHSVIQNFLSTHSTPQPAYEKGDKQTTLKSSSKLLVYPIKLEHH
jgi:hypothetical protein